MKRIAGWFALGTWFVLTVACATAWADTLTLKDGTTVTGEVVSMDRAQVVIKVKLGSGQATLTIARKDVASFALGDAPPPAPKKGKKTPRTRVRPKAQPRSKTGKPTQIPRSSKRGERVLFLVDHSGSMAIGKRWDQAVQQTVRMVKRLRKTALFDVVLFHDGATSLFSKNTWMKRNQVIPKRTGERLRKRPPNLRAGTNLTRAVRLALARNPDRLVVLTDGIVTRGGPDTAERAMEHLAKAASQGVRVSFIACQDGRFHAAKVEDLPAARKALETFARVGKGVFLPLPDLTRTTKLPSTFRPLAGSPAALPKLEIELLQADSKKRIVAKELRPYPTFRVRVLDPEFLRGKPLDVWEYGGSVWFEVIVREQGLILSRARALRLHRDGKHLVSDLIVRLVGGLDKSSPADRRAKRYKLVQAVPGATVDIVYHRGSKKFVDRRLIAQQETPSLEPVRSR